MKLSKSILTVAMVSVIATGVSAQEHLKSLDIKGVDKDLSPNQDFFNYVNKGWLDSHPLTPEYSRYGQFNILNDSSNNRVRRIVNGLSATNPKVGTDAYKIASIYSLAMDSLRRNKLGASPIKEDLSKIEKTTPAEMENLFLWLHKNYSSPFIAISPGEDLGNSKAYAMYVSAAGLGLGDRDYYLKNDKRNKDVRKAYQKLIQTEMKLAGYSTKDAKRIADNVLKIETLIADSTWTKEEKRNIPAMYNVRTLAQVKELYPAFPWDKYFEGMGIAAPENLIVTEFNTIGQGYKLYNTLSDREKKDLYLWEYVSAAAPYLSDAFADATFEFNKVMSGVQQPQPRWKKALAATEGVMGEGIGKLYVEKYFPESSKQYMAGLIENLRTALGKHIMHLEWMSDDTKLNAIKKLNAISVKIGYPDKWKDYSKLNIDPALSYWENMHNAHMWAQNEYLAKWGKPVDKSEWGMTPQTINAYYNPVNNEIVFPAGILQAPFFDAASSDAENYGGIGVVIGHELTHGFDDQGCNFDADGNMINWWLPEDSAAFKRLTSGLVDQFNKIEILPGLNANGEFTLGENIADQGGLRVAMTAFLDSQRKKGVDIKSESAKIDGLDPIQVFYMNYANLWANNIREEEMRSLTTGDPHSLGINRVNVSLKNLQPFFDAFKIKEGDKMFRPAKERVIIW